MEKIEEFCEKLIREKGLELDEEEMKEARRDMAERLLAQIQRAEIDALSEEKAKELAEKIDEMEPAQIEQFVADSGVDVEEEAITVMMQFRNLFLGNGS